jgi:hypothetical protein
MEKATDDSLDELAQRMAAYRESAGAARRLARAISDQRATSGLIAHAEGFEKKAEAIAAQIATLAHNHQDMPPDPAQDGGGLHASARMEPEDR